MLIPDDLDNAVFISSNFVVIRFNLSNLPIGTERVTPYSIYYYNYALQYGDNLFKTRYHTLASSKPFIHYFENSNTLAATTITAAQDYQNIQLDYYQMYEKLYSLINAK